MSVSLLVPASARAPAPGGPVAHEAYWQTKGCGHGYTVRQSRRGIRAVMRSPRRLTRARGRKTWRFARCVKTVEISRRNSRQISRWRRWRRSYRGWWRIQAMRTPYHSALAGLRWCESRGDYRYAGAHDGAYQYLVSTWARAQWWVPGRYRTWRANLASVDHQDVVTGRFRAAGHAGEWACSA